MKSAFCRLPVLLGFAFITASLPGATTWYVDGSLGSDLTGDGSSGNPWATIQYAIDDAGVVDGDTLNLGWEWYAENLLINKQLTIMEGHVEVPSFTGSHPCGIHIATDNVTLRDLDIETDVTLTGSGSLVYASRGGTPIQGLSLIDVLIDSYYYLGPGVTCLEVEQPRGMIVQGCDVIAGGAFSPVTHSGIHVIGGAPNGTQRNVIEGDWGTESPGGFGLRIEPGLGESASGFDILGSYLAFTSGTLIELLDSPLPSEGISDVRFLGGIAHSNDTNFLIRGCAGDTGPGISDVLIQSFWELGWSTSGIVVSQEGTGAPNIDFSSLVIRHCNIYNNSGYAIDNQIPGTTVMAEGNFWGGEYGPNATGGDDVSAGVDYTPYLDRYIDFWEWADIPAGATDQLLINNVALDIDLDDGVAGHVAMAFMDDYPGWGYYGMGGERGLDFSVDITSDLNPGDFIALMRVAYSDTDITTAGIDESQIAVFHFVSGTGWRVSVEDNTTGTPQWMGDSAPPTLPLTPADLGKHGVDMANNIVWAVVDHFTEFTGGESNNGQTVPVELSVFSVD